MHLIDLLAGFGIALTPLSFALSLGYCAKRTMARERAQMLGEED